MTEPAILIGGPHDGRVIAGTKANTIETVFIKPEPLIITSPRPSWWHLIRRMRWQPPPPPAPPEAIQLRYQADGTTDGKGHRVYRLASPWKPFTGPEIGIDEDLYPSLVNARYAVHPLIREDPATRWVMNLAWYKKCRMLAVKQGHDDGDDDDDPDSWVPSPDDVLLGTKICVTQDGGRPHLENARYSWDWPQ